MNSISHKIILITGASRGIGQATANLLALQGCRVFGTSRHATEADDFEMLTLDVTDDESVQACIQEVMMRAGRIDVLINNAGLEFLGAVEETPVHQIKQHFETNFFGAVRMMRAVLPHMRRQRSGLILNMSSSLGFMGAPFQGVYAAAKHALEAYSESLWYEVEPFGVHVTLVEPGFINTGLVYRKESPPPIPAYDFIREKLEPAWYHMAENAPSPHLVAEAILKIIEKDHPRLRYQVGIESTASSYMPRLLPFAAQAEIVRLFFDLGNPVKLAQKWVLPAGFMALAAWGLLRKKR